MTAEDIVRALAAQPAPEDRDYGNCLLCNMPQYDAGHEPTCPWRMAREWVAAERAELEERYSDVLDKLADL